MHSHAHIPFHQRVGDALADDRAGESHCGTHGCVVQLRREHSEKVPRRGDKQNDKRNKRTDFE
jgi:hypothetical protein